MTPTFSIREALRFGFDKTRQHSGFLFTIVVVMVGLQLLSGFAQTYYGEHLYVALFQMVVSAIGVVIGIGITQVSIRIAEGKEVGFSDLFFSWKTFIRYILANIYSGVLILLGLLLFIFPGVYLMFRYFFVKYITLAKDIKPTDALRESARITRGVKKRLALFVLAIVGINILGALLFLIGLVVTIPVSIIAMAFVYEKLSAEPIVEVAA